MDSASRLAVDLTEAAQRVRAGRLLAAEAAKEFEAAQRLERENRGRSFSLLRAIRMLDADPLSADWRTSLEKEVSDETARRYGVASPQPGRLYLELQQRDMTVAGVSGSNYLVGTTSRDSFVESLQGASIALRLGAQRINLDASDLVLPAVTTSPATYWLAGEDAQIPESQPTIGAIAATPKTCAALVRFSHQLARTSNPAVERVLTSELGRAVGAAIDRAAFNGSGANGEPLGILNTAGITSASGAGISLAQVAQQIADVTDAGASMLAPGFATTGAVRKIVMSKEVAAGGALVMPDANRLAGFPLFASKTGPTGALIFADWANVSVAQWGLLELLIDPFSGFRTGAISVRAMLHVDVLTEHPEAFSALLGVS